LRRLYAICFGEAVEPLGHAAGRLRAEASELRTRLYRQGRRLALDDAIAQALKEFPRSFGQQHELVHTDLPGALFQFLHDRATEPGPAVTRPDRNGSEQARFSKAFEPTHTNDRRFLGCNDEAGTR
jgi:hypothetical protein